MSIESFLCLALKRRLHHYETDKDGVCHFSNYYRICEEAFSALIHAECCEFTFAVVNATANYQIPLRAFDLFSVYTRLTEMRASSFQIEFTIQKDPTDDRGTLNGLPQICAVVTLKYVMIDPSTWRAIPLTPMIKNHINKILSHS